MHSGPYFAGHQHPDQNSFVIHAYGEKLAIDGGYYDWYGSPHFKAYSMTTLAHNTLLVDGTGQAACKRGADGRISHYFDSPGYGYCVGDASSSEIYGGKVSRFDRRLLFIKPGFAVIHDLVASASGAARYDWMLHAVVPIETDESSHAFCIPCSAAALRGRFLAPTAVNLKVTSGFPVEPVDGYKYAARTAGQVRCGVASLCHADAALPKKRNFWPSCRSSDWGEQADPRHGSKKWKRRVPTAFVSRLAIARIWSCPAMPVRPGRFIVIAWKPTDRSLPWNSARMGESSVRWQWAHEVSGTTVRYSWRRRHRKTGRRRIR